MSDLLGFLVQAKSWWRNKQRERAEALHVERKYVVHTNDSGPYVPDFWWVLEAGVPHCTWPQGATGEEEARNHLFKRFPDVNNETPLFAYGSTENARFVCWKR